MTRLEREVRFFNHDSIWHSHVSVQSSAPEMRLLPRPQNGLIQRSRNEGPDTQVHQSQVFYLLPTLRMAD